jgi:uncharacterized membrane protein
MGATHSKHAGEGRPAGEYTRLGLMSGYRHDDDGRLASGLGWFSVGLGVAEVAVPGVVARLIGVRDRPGARELLRAAGVREIASGLGILTRDRPAGWVWARVGGDVLDLAMLGLAYRSPESRPLRLAAATAALAGVTALDIVAGRRLQLVPGGRRYRFATKVLTINRPPAEVYGFWRDLENLPRFMRHLESVTTTAPGRSRWKVKGPAGTTVEWDAEIVEDRPSEVIAWRSLPGASVENGGFVRFRPAPGRKATEVKVHLEYHPPGGRLGSAIASLFGEEPGQQLQEDLRRFKQVMETGEIARSDASERFFGTKPGRPAPAVAYQDFARGKR